MEIGIDEYQDYETRMQILIGHKRSEKAKYEFKPEEVAPVDSIPSSSSSSDDEFEL